MFNEKSSTIYTYRSFFLSITGFAQTTYKIGDRAQGGIVFWIDETGQHGLVVSEEPIVCDFNWVSRLIADDLRFFL